MKRILIFKILNWDFFSSKCKTLQTTSQIHLRRKRFRKNEINKKDSRDAVDKGMKYELAPKTKNEKSRISTAQSTSQMD